MCGRLKYINEKLENGEEESIHYCILNEGNEMSVATSPWVV